MLIIDQAELIKCTEEIIATFFYNHPEAVKKIHASHELEEMFLDMGAEAINRTFELIEGIKGIEIGIHR